jgi:superfamily I DNA/RNA helicase
VRLADDYKDGMFIGTIHSLAARCLTMSGQGGKVGKAINEEAFDKFFKYIKEDPSCVLHYKYVLVDEAQDLSRDEYQFIFKMINPEHFFVVGDFRQNIYEGLKGASAKYMLQLVNEPGVRKYDLNENYRNKANILNYAKKTLKRI